MVLARPTLAITGRFRMFEDLLERLPVQGTRELGA